MDRGGRGLRRRLTLGQLELHLMELPGNLLSRVALSADSPLSSTLAQSWVDLRGKVKRNPYVTEAGILRVPEFDSRVKE